MSMRCAGGDEYIPYLWAWAAFTAVFGTLLFGGVQTGFRLLINYASVFAGWLVFGLATFSLLEWLLGKYGLF